ncbi:MAG: hypothetical protein RLY80_952 [Actinomycetota bacterium]
MWHGDAIGPRPLDIHIKGLEALGAKVHIEHGYIVTEAPNGLDGASIELDFPSVGATENIMMAAVLARGTTIIENAAREPDIVDIGNWAQRFLVLVALLSKLKVLQN